MNDFINDFSEDLEFSYTIEGGKYYEVLYKKAFPELKHMSSNKGDSQMQRLGIDRTLVLKSGKAIYIDEKNRRPKWDYEDIALEFIDNDNNNTPGWAEKSLFCDYITYTLLRWNRSYILPVPQLQLAWAVNKENWLNVYGWKPCKNKGYSSRICPIPVNVLYSALVSSMQFMDIQISEVEAAF